MPAQPYNAGMVTIVRCSALFAVFVGLAGPLVASDPLEPAGTGGIEAVDRALAKLQRNCRLLLVGAHPDDEDTTLLTYVARGLGCESAYLSLTRGDGGQNLIGPELGEALGVLRSEELLAARRIDGARQYFTRAFDYGYSKTLDEALAFWPHEVLLEDGVRVARRFMPHVVVSVFPPTSRAGHGQHQAAGLIAGELFAAAGDPEAVGSLGAEGLAPWTPRLFYREAWWDPEEATLELEAGILDPLAGRSYFQLAMESRSQHRCQSFGTIQQAGPRPIRLILETSSEGGHGGELFGGHDTRLRSIAELLPEPELVEILPPLTDVERIAAVARAGLAPERLAGSAVHLRDIIRALRRARSVVAGRRTPAARQVDDLLAEKEAIAVEALFAATGIVVDAITDRSAVVAGEGLEVEVVIWNAGRRPLDLGSSEIGIESSEGWTDRVAVAFEEAPEDGLLAPGAIVRQKVVIEIAEVTEPTVPYFLEHARLGPLYDWREVDPDLRGQPFAPDALSVRFALTLPAGPQGETVQVEMSRVVVERHRDLALGEVRTPLRVVPRVEVEVDPGTIVRSRSKTGDQPLHVRLTLNGADPAEGVVELDLPSDWSAGPATTFLLTPKRREERLTLAVPSPPDLGLGRYEIGVRAITEGGSYELSVPLVDYEHIRPRPLRRPAVAEMVSLDLAFPALERVGYVRGAGDLVPEALATVGVPIELLTPASLSETALADFDVVIVGPRAYESTPELSASNRVFLDYVEAGGTLIVQFQRWGYFEQGLPPYPMELTRRERTRTSDETAPVAILAPEHPALTTPNPIGATDWEGWVQERSTYNPVSWDEAYTALITMTDPGEEPAAGSLLVAGYGEGTYVYTGVAFFRQLPAGVPGAYRLFANLLGL